MNDATSSIVGLLGGGSGVDMTKLAGDLAANRFAARIAQLERKAEALELKVSAAATLKSQLFQLSSALGDRIRSGDLAPQATVGNGAVASASVAAGGTASGTYSLEVRKLATAQTLATAPYSSALELVGEGTLTIRFGSTAGGSFNSDSSQSPIGIDVGPDDTLEDVARSINATRSGVTAYVANTAEGTQLVIKGTDGEMNGFRVEASGSPVAPAPGNINYLAWDPATDGGELMQSATDAQFLFDGLEMTSSGNVIRDLPGGLTLTLAATNIGAPTRIGFGQKDAQIGKVMQDLIAVLNDVAGQLQQTANPLGGELGNDAGARALKRQLTGLASQIVMPGAAPGDPRTLGDLGLSINRDGTFRLDQARLDKTLNDHPQATAAMFTTGLYGVFATVDSLSRSAGATTNPGSIGGSITRYTSQRARIDEQLSNIAEEQGRLREQMVKNFSWADRRVSQSQSTLSFLQSQIDSWNAGRD
ncbi:flagellar filament capping protein FliD [Croceicoccus sp. F390]|uniref:Flagellar hook-associated protein 2 n=1 Tax=Croceicoccus esteveae TaxID=3075597 RepID=A0ABU2ZDJ4_9SPHN|nr:flagellar filament capping protein FliD [Croceicoccus sp. F390]MDT0574677.1 flagellar filament capping protein FliD [Croceicoccus sp. F390]